MKYTVKEIFASLQGEGLHAGRAAVFCRFAGCNLWSGIEEHRATAACPFCDTDFTGTDGVLGGIYHSAEDLSRAVAATWPARETKDANKFLVLTGGEPLLQIDVPLLAEFHREGFEIAVETNGTLRPPPAIDWITVSPKAGVELQVRSGDEIKLVFPQPGLDPERFEGLEFRYFYLQPLDGPQRDVNTRRAVQYCLEHPRWRLSLQIHKYLGIP